MLERLHLPPSKTYILHNEHIGAGKKKLAAATLQVSLQIVSELNDWIKLMSELNNWVQAMSGLNNWIKPMSELNNWIRPTSELNTWICFGVN